MGPWVRGRPFEAPPSTRDVVRQGWRPFHCLRAVLDGQGDTRALCRGLEPYRALAEVARERVYDVCRPDRLTDPDRRAMAERHPDCARALRGSAPPGAGAQWRRGDDEGALRWMFRRMGARGLPLEELDAEGRRPRCVPLVP